MELKRYTLAEWEAEGARRFGPDIMKWSFVCPICGNVASIEDFRPYKERGAMPNSATCECIGRYSRSKPAFGDRKKGEKPCDYAGYGLFRLSPVRVVHDDGKEMHSFAFADSGGSGDEPGEPSTDSSSPEQP